MDKTAFCDAIDKQLGEIGTFVRGKLETEPATLDKATALEKQRPALEAASQRITALAARIAALRASADPLSPATRAEIETDLVAIRQSVRT